MIIESRVWHDIAFLCALKEPPWAGNIWLYPNQTGHLTIRLPLSTRTPACPIALAASVRIIIPHLLAGRNFVIDRIVARPGDLRLKVQINQLHSLLAL